MKTTSPLSDSYEVCSRLGGPLPSLEFSSFSDDDDCREHVNTSRSLLDQYESEDMARSVLSTVSRLHFNRDYRTHSVSPTGSSVMETRSTFSSPGKTNVSLREKLSKLSRQQRKILLLGPGAIPKPSELTHKSSLLEERHPADAMSSSERRPTSRQLHDEADSLLRLKRQSLCGSKSAVVVVQPPSQRQTNSISLHIYDLIARDTLMQLPWGCICEIGKCFSEVNTALHQLGTGAYHVGVEVNGVEYAFGATNIPGKSGLFSCIPRFSPGYQYRTTIDFGERPLIQRTWVSVPSDSLDKPPGSTVYREVEEFVEGRCVIKQMAPEYMGADYDILRKNCCTFARDACLRLGIPQDEIPSWFGNLAESGALTQDAAYATVEPLLTALSCEEKYTDSPENRDNGFEVIARRNSAGTKEVVLVVPVKRSYGLQSESSVMRRTATLAY
jgi:hypothetical protein